MVNQDEILISVKSASIIILFLVILFTGNVPYKYKTFRENKSVVAIASAFSGGLFLAVSLLHLLPEAGEKFNEMKIENNQEGQETFPFPYLITICSFAGILFIEKIITNHKHLHSEVQLLLIKHVDVLPAKNSELLIKTDESVCCSQIAACCNQVEGNAQEDDLRKAVSSQFKMAQRVGFNEKKKKAKKQQQNLTPYFLQLAVGIHAIFEGLAIGIETNASRCIGIALAVFCHKWAEGLTLGLVFKKAKVTHSKAKRLIILQAAMNPIGVGIGWALSHNGNLIVGIFYSISAGTFLYISTIEVIVEEFNIARYKCLKYLAFILAIAFVSSIWFLEQMDF